jgi:2-keto-myo-inositol isomerase
MSGPRPLSPRFALNQMAVPRLHHAEFFSLAVSLGISEVEIRNDLPGQAIADGTSPELVRAAAAAAGVAIVSINALQRFNDWTAAREADAIALADYASASGARALVLVPVNDGQAGTEGERRADLQRALQGLRPILADRGLIGLVEPLGFATSSLRSKREAADAITAVDGWEVFRLLHDTFHHAIAEDRDLYPLQTELVHISGVADREVALAEMRDSHRELIDVDDRLANVEQIEELLAGGYEGLFSFEPFAPVVHELAAPREAIEVSIAHIAAQLMTRAAPNASAQMGGVSG